MRMYKTINQNSVKSINKYLNMRNINLKYNDITKLLSKLILLNVSGNSEWTLIIKLEGFLKFTGKISYARIFAKKVIRFVLNLFCLDQQNPELSIMINRSSSTVLDLKIKEI